MSMDPMDFDRSLEFEDFSNQISSFTSNFVVDRKRAFRYGKYVHVEAQGHVPSDKTLAGNVPFILIQKNFQVSQINGYIHALGNNNFGGMYACMAPVDGETYGQIFQNFTGNAFNANSFIYVCFDYYL